jgi:hypothetical protein
MSKENNNEERGKQIMSAQFRKQASIAYFNALNSAIAITSAIKYESDEVLRDHIVYWRDYFLSEYMDYHNKTIENITPESMDVNDAIKRVLACVSVSEVRRIAAMMPDSVRNADVFIDAARAHIKSIRVAPELPTIES